MKYDFIVSETFSLNPQEIVNITVTNRGNWVREWFVCQYAMILLPNYVELVY